MCGCRLHSTHTTDAVYVIANLTVYSRKVCSIRVTNLCNIYKYYVFVGENKQVEYYLKKYINCTRIQQSHYFYMR